MKKIEKFQFGGTSTYTVNGITPPSKFEYVGDDSHKYTPDDRLFNPYQTQKIKAPELDTETLNKLAGKGHTNATNKVIGDAYKAKQMLEAGMASNPNYIYTEEGKSLMQRMTVSPQMLNQLERDVKNTENYQKVTKDNAGDSAISVSSRGTLLVKNSEGQLQEISMRDYISNPRSFKLLNNSEVYNEKDTNPNLSFKDVGDYTTNTWGSDKVTDYMNKFMTNWGVNASKKEAEVISDLKRLGSADSVMGWINTKGGNENNKQQMIAALDSFKAQLPIQVRNTLMANALSKSSNEDDLMTNYNKAILNFFYRGHENKTESSISGKTDKNIQDRQFGVGDYKKTVDTSELADKLTTSRLMEDAKSLNFQTGKFNVTMQGLPLPHRNQQNMTYDDPKNIFRNLASSNADKVYTATGKPLPKDTLKTMVLRGDASVTVLPIDKRTGQPIPLEDYQKRYGRISGEQLMGMLQTGQAKKFVIHEANFNYDQEHWGIKPKDEQLRALAESGDIELFDKSTEKGKEATQIIKNAIQTTYNPNKDKDFENPFLGRDTAARTTVLIPVDLTDAGIIEVAQDADAQKSGINHPEQFNAASTYMNNTKLGYTNYFGIQ